MKAIQKLGKAKFKISTPNVPSSDLELDFNPIIEQFKLEGNFCLIHWQARPKGHREWGIYSSVDDTYQSQGELKVNMGTVKSLQLNDATAKSIPSAVLYTNAYRLTCINDSTIIGDVLLSDIQN